MAPTAPGVLSASWTNLSERFVDMLSKASSTAHVLAWPVSTQSMSVKRISLARPDRCPVVIGALQFRKLHCLATGGCSGRGDCQSHWHGGESRGGLKPLGRRGFPYTTCPSCQGPIESYRLANHSARGFYGVYGLVDNTPGSTSSNLARTS